MGDSEIKTAPSDAAIISREMVKLLRRIAGRGPTKARTTIGRDHVLVMLHEMMTQAEKTLVEAGHAEKVESARQALQETMRTEAVRMVEETLHRRVVGFMSANELDQDMSVEVFVLAPVEDGGEPHVQEGEASGG